eukprot:479435_1
MLSQMSSVWLMIMIYGTYAQYRIHCHPNLNCTINCANHTKDGEYISTLNCNDSSVVDATGATNLHILCNYGPFGCKGLTVECPSYQQKNSDEFCRIDCMYDNGCYDIDVTSTSGKLIEVNCINGNRTCNNMLINSSDTEVNISCSTQNNNNDPICESLDIMVNQSGTLNLNCYDKGICNNISVNTYHKPKTKTAEISVFVYDKGELINSKINGTINADSFSLYSNTKGNVKNNTFLFDTAESIIVIKLYNNSNIFENEFYVTQVPNISILSDLLAHFNKNNIYGDIHKAVHFQDVIISNSNIRIPNSNILQIINSQITSNTLIRAD